MRFSIITITKNNDQGLARTKASVEAQIFTDYEWIVIDGAKTPDNGIYDAMNKGISQACGDYIIFMNAGDEFANAGVLAQIALYEADFIYGDSIENGHIKKARPITKINQGMVTHHQAMVYRREILADLTYDETYHLAADYKLTLQIIARSRCILYCPIVVCIFEIGGVSQTHAAAARAQESAIRQELSINAPLVIYRQWIALWIKKICPALYWRLKILTA